MGASAARVEQPDLEPDDAGLGPDWRVWLGLGLTALWVLLQAYYIVDVVGFARFVDEGPPSVGGFLEGAFAPLAFLWLVIGFFLQRKELENSRRAIQLQHRELRRTAEQAERQAESIAANELHARRDTFLRVAELVNEQLGAILGLLFMSSQGPAGDGPVSAEEINDCWGRLGSGDRQIFGRMLLSLHFTGPGPRASWELFYGTPTRARHSENFAKNFERLLETARAADPEGLLPDALLGSAHGRIYELVLRFRGGPPAE
jgi:hypothetical protein